MKVDFDEEKRAATLSKRGLDMADAAAVSEGIHLTFADDRKDYGRVAFRDDWFLAWPDGVPCLDATWRCKAHH